MSYWPETLDGFIASRFLRHADLPNVWPDDYTPPVMEPIKVDESWIELRSLENLRGDELEAILQTYSYANHCQWLGRMLRKRLNQLRVRGGRRRRTLRTRRVGRLTPPAPKPPPPPPPEPKFDEQAFLWAVNHQIQRLINDP